MRPFRFVAALALVALTVAVKPGGPGIALAQPAPDAEAAPGEIVVRFSGARGSEGQQQVGNAASVSVKNVWGGGRYATLLVPTGREAEFRAWLQRLPGVLRAEPNYVFHPAFVPDDQYYGRQWNLPAIQMEEAWDVSRGAGVTVAVLDTGVAFEDHESFALAPDLAETAFVHPYDAVVGDAHPNDNHGHGTHVTGTIAQNTNNGIGAAGIAPDAAIMPVRVCLQNACLDDAIARGLFWAVDHGADVVNLSLGGDATTQSQREALQYAEDNGVLVVAAAGNGGGDKKGDPSLDYPAAIETVFSAGAVRYDGTRAPYSNYGSGEDGSRLDIVAPGGDLKVDQNGDGEPDGIVQNTYAHLCGGSFSFSQFGYCPYQGTSMAAPHVSGVAALLLSGHPDLTPPDVREVLRCSALDLGPPGEDIEYGAGLVQAADALRDSDGDGTVDCLDGVRITIGSAEAPRDDTARVSVTAFADPPGIGAYTLDISYDNAVVKPIACAPLSGGLCDMDYAPGVIRVADSLLQGVIGSATLADIDFRATGPPGSHTGLDVQLVDIADITMSDLSAETRVIDGGITVIDMPGGLPGDLDCDKDVDSLDGLLILRDTTGLWPAAPCHGDGDVDCDGDVGPVDSLLVVRHVAGLSVAQPPGCPPIGVELKTAGSRPQ